MKTMTNNKSNIAFKNSTLLTLIILVVIADHAYAETSVILNNIRGHYISTVAIAHVFRASDCGKKLKSFGIETLTLAKNRVRPFLKPEDQRWLDSGEVEKLASQSYKEMEKKIANAPTEIERCSTMTGYIYGSFFTAKGILQEINHPK